MKIGFLTCAENFKEEDHNQPVWRLRDALALSGHEIILLDTAKAAWGDKNIVYPELLAGDEMDFFIGYYSGDTDDIDYFKQLEHLSARYASPTNYVAQDLAQNKTALINIFEKERLPKPVSYDGNSASNRAAVLNEIQKGVTIVMKPDFGGSGWRIVKVDTLAEAQKAFNDFDERNEPFMMQHYIETKDENGLSADYRAYVVGDDVLAGIKRTAKEGEWKTNLALGSTITPHQFTPQQERDAVKALQGTGLAFGAVDILIDTNTGEHYICEVNDACSGTQSIEAAHKGLDIAQSVAAMLERKYQP